MNDIIARGMAVTNSENIKDLVENLRYYNDVTVEITPVEYFTYSIDEDNEQVTITGLKDEVKTTITQVAIPYKIENYPVTKIGDYAFFLCNDLTTVIIPNSIVSIGLEGFYDCPELRNIDMPMSVTSIGSNTFTNCNNLTIICFPYSYAEQYAIDNGINYKYKVDLADYEENLVNIEGEIKSLQYYGDANIVPSNASLFTFATNDATMTASVSAASKEISGDIVIPYECVINGKVYTVTSISDDGFLNCVNITKVTIPSSITKLGASVFRNCTQLKRLVIPDSVTKIGEFICSGCYNIESITLPRSVETMDTLGAVNSCSKLKTITLPDGIAYIEKHVVNSCDNLKNITIPKSVKYIYDSAFTSKTTTQLTDVYYEGTKEQWDKIEVAADNDGLLNATIHYGFTDGDNTGGSESGVNTVAATGLRAVYNQEINFISYANDILTLNTPDNFFEVNEIAGFRILNKTRKQYIDIVKVLNKEQNGENWNFIIETPLEILGLGTPNNIEILPIIKDVSVVANNQHTEGVGSYAIGDIAHVEGYENLGAHEYVHVEGWGNVVLGRAGHGEGYNTKVLDNYGHSEGAHTEAGYCAHSEGDSTLALGINSHTEGTHTLALGANAHAEGSRTEAKKDYTHTEGNGTVAGSRYQHVQGKFNIEDAEDKYAHITGNGTSDTERSNAHTLDWDGNAWFAGDIKVGGKSYDDSKAKKVALQEDVAPLYSLYSLYYNNLNNDITPEEYFSVNSTGSIFYNSVPYTITNVVIPPSINGITVTRLEENAFDTLAHIEKLVMPNTITSVVNDRHWTLPALKELKLSENLIEIGDFSFYAAKNLSEVILPQSVKSIGDHAFANTIIERITIPDSVTYISSAAFMSCEHLKEVIIGKGVTELNQYTFFANFSLERVVIPSNVTYIHTDAFIHSKSGFVIVCEQGSYAEQWAKEHNIEYYYSTVNGKDFDALLSKVAELEEKLNNLA